MNKLLIKPFEPVLLIKHMSNTKLYFDNEAYLNNYAYSLVNMLIFLPKNLVSCRI